MKKFTESERKQLQSKIEAEQERQQRLRKTIGRNAEERETPVVDIPMSTTPSLPSYKIKKVVGIVAGEAIMGANVISDALAGITDIVGGRSGTYENRLKEGRQLALDEMAQEAENRGGNGVIGIDIDYETIRGGMLMVTASGTAVIVEPEEHS